jgi:lipoic acid synthetase
MLGLGEEQDEVLAVLDDLRAAGCTTLTLGQYLAPSPRHHPVVRYLSPEEFAELEAEARARGFRAVASAPYVRSSFRAGELYRHARGGDTGHAAHP